MAWIRIPPVTLAQILGLFITDLLSYQRVLEMPRTLLFSIPSSHHCITLINYVNDVKMNCKRETNP